MQAVTGTQTLDTSTVKIFDYECNIEPGEVLSLHETSTDGYNGYISIRVNDVEKDSVDTYDYQGTIVADGTVDSNSENSNEPVSYVLTSTDYSGPVTIRYEARDNASNVTLEIVAPAVEASEPEAFVPAPTTMTIITRAQKGSKLTHEEMDHNLLVLERRKITAGGGAGSAMTDVKIADIPLHRTYIAQQLEAGRVLAIEVDLMSNSEEDGIVILKGVLPIEVEVEEDDSLSFSVGYPALNGRIVEGNYSTDLTIKDDINHIHVMASINSASVAASEHLVRTMWYFIDEKEATLYEEAEQPS